jgi:antitoxin (DNA-binding transcriptional repressor) of toxin-antitoxin stability system
MFQPASEDRFNDPNRLTVSFVAQHFSQVINEVHRTKLRKLITKNGRAIAAISPLKEVAIVENITATTNTDNKGADNE